MHLHLCDIRVKALVHFRYHIHENIAREHGSRRRRLYISYLSVFKNSKADSDFDLRVSSDVNTIVCLVLLPCSMVIFEILHIV